MRTVGRLPCLQTFTALLGVGTLALAGCGTQEIDSKKVEQLIQRDVERKGLGQTVKAVKCPGGQPSRTGHAFDCTLAGTDGSTATVPVRVRNGEDGVVAVGQQARSGGGRQPGAAGAERARDEFISALNKWQSGMKRYSSRMEEDAEARNIPGIDANVSGWRDTYYEFDGELRKIQMPPQLQPDLNRVLEMNRTLIGDFDAYGAATSNSEKRRMLKRIEEDIDAAPKDVMRLAKALDKASE